MPSPASEGIETVHVKGALIGMCLNWSSERHSELSPPRKECK